MGKLMEFAEAAELHKRGGGLIAALAHPEEPLIERCIAIILHYEGWHHMTDDPDDPGGLTKYGIAKNYNPDVDVANLTAAQAVEIYRERYWKPCRCDELPGTVALVVFDCAVNQGTSFAKKNLQAVVGAKRDGVIGPNTMARVHNMQGDQIAADFTAKRLQRYAVTRNYDKYGWGWFRRACNMLIHYADLGIGECLGTGE